MPFTPSQDGIAAGRFLARSTGIASPLPSASSPSDQCVASGRRAFEACPFYLGEVHAPMALRTVFPHLRAIAVLRNPRERTTSAFNDYVRVGRIRRANATASGMESLIYEKLRLLATKQRTLESFDMRMLTSGVYIHGLRKWGDPGTWPQRQLLVLRSEDLFGSTVATMGRVQKFLAYLLPSRPACCSACTTKIPYARRAPHASSTRLSMLSLRRTTRSCTHGRLLGMCRSRVGRTRATDLLIRFSLLSMETLETIRIRIVSVRIHDVQAPK